MPEVDPIAMEEWRQVNGHPAYEVSNLGRVRSFWTRKGVKGKGRGKVGTSDKYRILKPYASAGRLTVTLGGGETGGQKNVGVAYLVLCAFVGEPQEGQIARHLTDPDPNNCRLDNLAWGTYSDNAGDIRRLRGKHNSSRLTDTQRVEVQALIRQGIADGQVAEQYGVTAKYVAGIRCKMGITYQAGVASRTKGCKLRVGLPPGEMKD